MTAHIVFAGGGLVLPARTPYELQILREYVLDRARHKEQMRINVGRKTWIVERASEDRPFACARCKRQQLTVAALRKPGNETTYCVACSLR
ncbi:MAG: hypothetical protein ACHQ9S_04125 [Candidatus Binatia bacterium]